VPVRLLTSAAPDEALLDELAPFVAEMRVVPAQSSSIFENVYDSQGHRTQYIRGVASPLSVEHLPSEWLASPLVHLAPLTGEVDPQMALCFPESTVMLTLQGWLRRWGEDGRVYFKRWFDEDVLEHIDIVVFSEEDIYEAPDLEQLFAGAVPHLFVTRAERGGTYYHQGRPISYTTPQVKEVNSTGAGDVFAASILASLDLVGGDMQAAVQVAAYLGANAITRPWLDGAPTKDEVQLALAQGSGT
jgi:sugar/nucleoside kinase (ribokinase family)